MKEIKCHDCGKQAKIKGKELLNGVIAEYKAEENIKVFKCQDCFNKNKSLTNYQPCEVYSRVVGYLRPVKQWHPGKQQEYNERKEYKGRIIK